MRIIFNKKEGAKPDRCIECKYNFSDRSHKYFCCDKNMLVCQQCHNKVQCKACSKLRTNKCIKCSQCRNSYSQTDTFYDFKADFYYCSKCIANRYIHGYEQMVRQNEDPKYYMIRLNQKSEYCIEDFINFFKRWCFCCLKQFNRNAYQMKYGARICQNCLQNNFQIALPKLITCIECSGYIRDLSEIKLEITPTQILCIYCSVDELKTYDALKKKSEIDPTKSSQIVNQSSIKNRGIIIAASQISKLNQENSKGQIGQNLPPVIRSSLLKVISRSSIEEQSLNFTILVEKTPCLTFCIICNSCCDQSSVFQLTQQEIDYYGLAKLTFQKKVPRKICLMCFTQASSMAKMKTTQKKQFQQLPDFNSNKQLPIALAPSMNIPAFQSVKSFPLSPRSPRAKIFQEEIKIQKSNPCQVCQVQYVSVKMQEKRLCRTCFNKRFYIKK